MSEPKVPPPAPDFDQLAIDLCRDLYDRFVMGGWCPKDAHAEVVHRLQVWHEAQAPAPLSTAEPPTNDPATKYPVLVVCALIERDGKVLLERRAPAGIPGLDLMFDLPGGKVENGESPRDAIVRELQEELGVTVEPLGLLPELKQSAWDYGKGVRHWILATYRCRIVDGEPRFGENLRWLSYADISESNTLAADLSIIRKYLAPLPEPEAQPSAAEIVAEREGAALGYDEGYRAGRESALEEAAKLVDSCRFEGSYDLRAIRDSIRALSGSAPKEEKRE